MVKKVLMVVIGLILFPSFFYAHSWVTGEVVDAESGAPIKDVLVIVADAANNSHEFTTDEKGIFHIGNVAVGPAYIGFFPPAPYAWELDKNEMQPFSVERYKTVYIRHKLVHGGVLELTLIDVSTNTPLEGVDVNVIGSSIGLQTRRYWQPSDKEGKYRMPQLMGSKYKLILSKDGWGMKVIPDVEVRLKETTTMTIQYNGPDAAMLTGMVKCEKTGVPLTDIFVGVNRIAQYGWAHTYTDDKGRYTFLDLEPGEYKVKVFGLKDRINDREHTVYIRQPFRLIKRFHSITDFTVDCTLYFQKKWELSWYKKQ